MRKIRLCLLFIFALPFLANAQDFSYSNVQVSSVTFSGGLQIRKDDGTGSYTGAQWIASSIVKSPVAYISGNAPVVSAVFSITCPAVPDSVYLRGSGSDAILFSARHVPVAPSGTSTHTISYPATTGSHVFAPAIVRFFKPYTIDWEISFDGVNWKSAGSTDNTLYVTRSAPRPETTQFKWFHTVFDLSCRNAQYQSLDTAIISHVWSEFLDHVVLNYRGDSLFYYKIMNSPNVTLASLLKFHDAECYTFAQLFLASIKIQGVIRTNNYVYITPMGNSVCGNPVNRFLVKDWSFGTPSASSTCPDFPFSNTYTTLIPPPFNAYDFVTADVTDQAGIPGSCTANPSSYFNNHQIALIDGVYYDACYGVTFPSLAAIKTAAFSGWSYRYTSGSTTYCFFTPDLTLSDLTETISSW